MSIEWKEDGAVLLTEEDARQFLYQIGHPDLVQVEKCNSLLELGRRISNNGNRILTEKIKIERIKYE